MQKNIFFINTLWILIMGLIIKVLGLLNRIIITRFLGIEGVSLYILAFPTIMLFVNIASFSLNISMSKLISESLKTQLYSPKKLLSSAYKIAIFVSLIAIILLLILIYPLISILLKEPKLLYPILSCVILIPLVGISDSLKGYFNGLKLMKISSLANLCEQIARIIFTIIFLIITKPLGIITSTTFCLLALSFGEIISILYSLNRLKKYPPIHYPDTKNEVKAIFKFAFPTTLSRLIGSITFFLEPIIYTLILTRLNYPSVDIKSYYTIINAYTIPLLTIGSFISFAISTAIIPGLSESYVQKRSDDVHYYIDKALLFSIVPAIIMSLILFFYSNELMILIYGVNSGAILTKNFVFLFLPYYLSIPLTAILQSMGKIKELFRISTILNILKLGLIFILAIFPSINYLSILVSTALIVIINFIIYFILVKRYTDYHMSFKKICLLSLLFITGFCLYLIAKHFNINYLLASVIISLLLIVLAFWNNLLSISSFKKNS